ncbi:Abi-domain-containing protein [Anaeromyces robustus]|uniref:Abi-domain-containing protein n=1 Tax=Anaeromyces robustus TaxID=1754192 RepID=A0A1Y1W986_9FUNG|nr:Abi-domain-containing protein [Anaeromyces robustus]|eukprot:ORX69816.1 Abi-domain-containing protein [Anaeromyces robustus]
MTNNDDNDYKLATDNVAQPDQEIKKRPIKKQIDNEEINEKNENVEGGEGEEEEESEYEYEFVPTTGFYVVIGTILLAIIGFIIFINLDYPMSKKVKGMFISSLIDFKNQFFMKKVYIAAILAFIFIQVATAISSEIVERINPDAVNSNNRDLNDFSNSSMVGAFIVAALCFPIGEELFFRKFLFGIINHFSKILAYLISSFVFAFYHFEFDFTKLKEEFTRFPLYLLSGFTFAYVYDYTGCILASIIAHFLNNTKAVILSFLGELK